MPLQNPTHEPGWAFVGPETQLSAAECPLCSRGMISTSDEYVCMQRCLFCEYTRVLGWFGDAEPLLVLGGRRSPHGHEIWARQVAAQGVSQ